VLDGRFKLMLRGDQPTALYDVLADPAETRSVLRSQPEAAAQLQRAAGLLATGAGQGETAVQDAEVLEHLRALGYVD
jgi:hypothetical protein